MAGHKRGLGGFVWLGRVIVNRAIISLCGFEKMTGKLLELFRYALKDDAETVGLAGCIASRRANGLAIELVAAVW